MYVLIMKTLRHGQERYTHLHNYCGNLTNVVYIYYTSLLVLVVSMDAGMCMYVCMYVCITYVGVYMYVYIYIYTYIYSNIVLVHGDSFLNHREKLKNVYFTFLLESVVGLESRIMCMYLSIYVYMCIRCM
jgi:hypothetical protein